MPIITVEITPQSYEKKTEIAKAFTEELHRITGIPREPITVLFHALPVENISSGGTGMPRNVAERAMRAAFLSGRNMAMRPSFWRKALSPSKQEIA